jgi:metal-responsive CopG/Arc/MetJ family transcriptional regulator
MTTKIDIPKSVLDAVDRTAERLGSTRERVIVEAVSRYVGGVDADAVTAKLDEVYGQHASPVDPVLHAMQTRSLPKDEW